MIRNENELTSDVESLALRVLGERRRAYLFGSMSNDPLGEPDPARRRLARLALDAAGGAIPGSVQVISGNPIRVQLNEHFQALDVWPYYAYSAPKARNTERWGNIEGADFIPGGNGAVLCGLRNPLANQDALLAVVEGLDEAFDARDGQRLRVTDLFRLDLGGRGVADLRWDPLTQGYLIVAARSSGPKLDDDQPYPRTNLASAVFWWSGDKRAKPVMIARSVDMNLEAVCRIGDTPLIALGSDEGDVSEARSARQSVIVLMVFTSPPQPGEVSPP